MRAETAHAMACLNHAEDRPVGRILGRAPGIVLAIAREDASPPSGLGIVLGCFVILAGVRFSGRLASTGPQSRPLTPARIAGLLVGSILFSALVLAVADYMFLTVHETVIYWFR